jgi:hypothetical protein
MVDAAGMARSSTRQPPSAERRQKLIDDYKARFRQPASRRPSAASWTTS